MLNELQPIVTGRGILAIVFILLTALDIPTPLNVFKFKTGGHRTITNIGLDYIVVDPRTSGSKISLVKHVQKFNQSKYVRYHVFAKKFEKSNLHSMTVIFPSKHMIPYMSVPSILFRNYFENSG